VKSSQPLTIWLAGIAVLVVLLVVGGAFDRPAVFVIAAVAAVALVAGFLFARRPR